MGRSSPAGCGFIALLVTVFLPSRIACTMAVLNKIGFKMCIRDRAEGIRQGKAEAEKAGKRSLSEAEERVQKLRKELDVYKRQRLVLFFE